MRPSKGSTDEVVHAGDIRVATFHGTVQISGFVNTAEGKTRAEMLAMPPRPAP